MMLFIVNRIIQITPQLRRYVIARSCYFVAHYLGLKYKWTSDCWILLCCCWIFYCILKLKPVNDGKTRPIPWLLMPWRCKERNISRQNINCANWLYHCLPGAPFYQRGLSFIVAWAFIIKCGMKLLIHSQISMVQQSNFRTWCVVSSHTILGMWLLVILVLMIIHISKGEAVTTYLYNFSDNIWLKTHKKHFDIL